MPKKSTMFTRIDRDGEGGAGLASVPHDPTDTPVEGAGSPKAYIAYADTTGQLTAGVWACDAGTLEINNLPFDEVCFVIDGEVEVTDDKGISGTFGEGDAFVLHKGFTGTWRMPRPFRKFNAIFTVTNNGQKQDCLS
jgi:uncharacterized cupin superfamily protein